MTIYITERPSNASSCAAEFVDANGAVVAEWQWDRYAICDVLTVNGDRFPGLTLQDARAELNALGYVLTDEFPPADVDPLAEIDADDIDFARETLGDAASHVEVSELAHARADVRAAEAVVLSCGMTDCQSPVTHLDQSGFVYCTAHGIARRSWKPCRKLRPFELRRLGRGEQITRY